MTTDDKKIIYSMMGVGKVYPPNKKVLKDLNVNKNLTIEKIKGEKYLWKIKGCDQKLAHSISLDHNLSLPLAQVLVARGFYSNNQINSYLFSTYQKDVHDPILFKDAVAASEKERLRL